jgi:hypothetical protein
MGRQFERARLECGGAQNSVGFNCMASFAVRCDSLFDGGLGDLPRHIFGGKRLEVLGIDRCGLASSGGSGFGDVCLALQFEAVANATSVEDLKPT